MSGLPTKPAASKTWLDCFSFEGGGEAAPAAFDTMHGYSEDSYSLSEPVFLAKLPSISDDHQPYARVKKYGRNRIALSSGIGDFTMKPLQSPGNYVRRILGLPSLEIASLASGPLFNALCGNDDENMLDFFIGLSDAVVTACTEMAEQATLARVIHKIRELFAHDLALLSEEQFRRLSAATFGRRFLEFKYAFRHMHPVDASEAAILAEDRARFAETYRKTYALHTGAWDAFGAALMADAARRGITIAKPDTRTVGCGLSKSDKVIIGAYRKILAVKSRRSVLSRKNRQPERCR